jgi:hypothetical protein
MLVILETQKTKYLLYRIYGGLSVLFEDEAYMPEAVKKMEDSSFLLKDVRISYYENTSMVEVEGSVVDTNKYKLDGIVTVNKVWKFRTSNYVFVFTPSSTSEQQILHG